MHFSGQCQDLGICATKVGHSGRQGCDFLSNKSPNVLLSIPPQGQLGDILAAGLAEQTWHQKNCRPHTKKCPEHVATGQRPDLAICETKVGHFGQQDCEVFFDWQTHFLKFCLVYRLKDSRATFWLLVWLSRHGTKRIAGRTRPNFLNTWPHAFLRAVSRSWDLCDEGRAFRPARVRFSANKSPKVLLSIPPQRQLGASLAAGLAEQTWHQKNCRPHTTKCPEHVATCISQGSVKILGSVRRRSGILDGKGAICCQKISKGFA